MHMIHHLLSQHTHVGQLYKWKHLLTRHTWKTGQKITFYRHYRHRFFLYYHLNVTDVYFHVSKWKTVRIGLGYGLVLSMWQAITWTNDYLVHRHMSHHTLMSQSLELMWFLILIPLENVNFFNKNLWNLFSYYWTITNWFPYKRNGNLS